MSLTLTFTTLKFSRQQTNYIFLFFFFFQENRLTFHENCLLRSVKAYFLEKIKKKMFQMSAEFFIHTDEHSIQSNPFVCVEVLQPCQCNGVMPSEVIT